MESGLISIIVPIYNLEDYLPRCVRSICRQTYPNLEIILVDDGSTDRSKDVIARLAQQDVRIVSVYKQNGGVTSARLEGVKVAKGEWIGFVDGDDEIDPDMYEFLLKNAIEYQSQISHCGYRMEFADGRVNYFYNTGMCVQHDKIAALKELLSGSKIEPGLCNKLFHKTLFHSLLHTEMMNRSIKINEDLLMNYILFSNANKSVFQDICKYHYLVRSTSTSRASLNQYKIFDPIRVKQLILDMKIDGMEETAERAYIGTCINVYNSIVLDKTGQFVREQKEIWNLVNEHKAWIPFLSTKQKILAGFILYWPAGYEPIYRFYAKYLLKNPYE